jgi:DNA-binding NtrC family response regulator
MTAEAPQRAHILVVDDDDGYRSMLERILSRAGYSVATACDGREGLDAVNSEQLDLVLVDVNLPGINGIELVRQIKDIDPTLPCIVITGQGSAEYSLEALKAGAYWYLDKHFEQGNPDPIRRLVEQAVEHKRLKVENRLLQTQLRSQYGFGNIVGNSTALQESLDIVRKVADSDSTCLVTGESGTGKELIARALHYNSQRSDRMLVTVNCGAIPEELLESELFGHVKGAFTNASNHREGRFSVANGGTIFLDEIGDMSLKLQVKLLRVLQERTFEPVGSSKTVEVDVRVIAATNQDLPTAISESRFREDLYYRLNVIPIEIPGLRERTGDVELLAAFFIEKLNKEKNKRVSGISAEALSLLGDYAWPGNVRELENTMERMIVLRSEGEIDVDDLPRQLRTAAPASDKSMAPKVPSTGISFNDMVDRFETDLISQALDKTSWNKNKAAKMLGLNRTTLLEKIKKKKLSTPESDD